MYFFVIVRKYFLQKGAYRISLNTCTGPGHCFLQRSSPPPLGPGLYCFCLGGKEERPLGMSLSPNTVSHTSHRRCAIPNIVSVSFVSAGMTPNSSDMSCPSRLRRYMYIPNQLVLIVCWIPYLLHTCILYIFDLRHANNYLLAYCKQSTLQRKPNSWQRVWHPRPQVEARPLHVLEEIRDPFYGGRERERERER